MIFYTAYDTTMGSYIDTRQIEKGILEAIVRDSIYNDQLDLKVVDGVVPVFITGANGSAANVPFFAHPILVTYKDIRYLVTDIRPFVKAGEPFSAGGEPPIRNITEFSISKSRAILNMAWLGNQFVAMRNELIFASTVFASWLSEVIAKKYALDPKDQLVLNIMCHYYYQTLFTNEEIDEVSLHKFSIHTIKATRAPSDLVIDTFSKMGAVSGIESFCLKVPQVLENVRLNDFNFGVMLTIVANSWYGLNSREILSVAIEHPPTWFSLVYGALTQRTFKTSMIAKVAERYGKNGNADNFLKAYSSFVKYYTVVKTVGREELYIRPFEG